MPQAPGAQGTGKGCASGTYPVGVVAPTNRGTANDSARAARTARRSDRDERGALAEGSVRCIVSSLKTVFDEEIETGIRAHRRARVLRTLVAGQGPVKGGIEFVTESKLETTTDTV